MQWQEHISAQILLSQILPKQKNAMERYERKNKKEIHKELQDLDPIGSPHLEEILIGGKIDLDLLSLSLFPQKDARIIGGIER
jgi:hypothetical protein